MSTLDVFSKANKLERKVLQIFFYVAQFWQTFRLSRNVRGALVLHNVFFMFQVLLNSFEFQCITIFFDRKKSLVAEFICVLRLYSFGDSEYVEHFNTKRIQFPDISSIELNLTK